jgi:hypothetical protein
MNVVISKFNVSHLRKKRQEHTRIRRQRREMFAGNILTLDRAVRSRYGIRDVHRCCFLAEES